MKRRGSDQLRRQLPRSAVKTEWPAASHIELSLPSIYCTSSGVQGGTSHYPVGFRCDLLPENSSRAGKGT